MMGGSVRCYIPSFVEIGLTFPEKKIFEGFLPYMGMAARSCDHYHINEFLFPCTGLRDVFQVFAYLFSKEK